MKSFRTASALLVLLCVSCTAARKIDRIRTENIAPVLSPADDYVPSEVLVDTVQADTIIVKDADGREMYLMSAVEDDSGEMVANETLNAAIKIASFKNVAERHGKVDLRFNIIVAKEMLDSRWQWRFTPEMYILGDTLTLEQLFITGEAYRKAQMRGYQQYERFLSTIITDSTEFIWKKELEVFLQRNLPDLYAFKTDSSYVSDEVFCSVYGVSEEEAVLHYTDKFRKMLNSQREGRKDRMFRRYVKSPIVSEGLRLDKVVDDGCGDIIYEYVQTIEARPKLKKAEIVLSGAVYDQEKEILGIPRTDPPLVFYISSLSSIVDETPRYRTKVLSRRVTSRSSYGVEFALGRSDLDETLGDNASELAQASARIRSLLGDAAFVVDSVATCASASPEGSFATNRMLSQKRSAAMCGFVERTVKEHRDSVTREEGVRLSFYDLENDLPPTPDILVKPEVRPENWDLLESLVYADGYLSEKEKAEFSELMTEPDPDSRERHMASKPWYGYVREYLYPRLRRVDLTVYLHRRDMVLDTVVTFEIDSLYMEGVRAIRERDYKTALAILKPYSDYNTAVACTALDYNATAMDILAGLKETPRTLYLKALVHSRRGEDRLAVQCYLDACASDRSFVHRGNLDPEISSLIKKYKLNTDL